MRRPLMVCLVAATLVVGAASPALASGTGSQPVIPLSQVIASLGLKPALTGCANPAGGADVCDSRELVRPNGEPYATTGPTSGYGPSQLLSAYHLAGPAASGSGTVAIVDAMDDPNAEADLAVYRSQYGLSACTTANGCFKKVNENGVQGSYPTGDAGWATEISLDIEMVSAICPHCHILLVEANSANQSDLSTAENTAASFKPSSISNSYGGSETSTQTSSDTSYNHPGTAITVSSGDSGYGVEYPASSPYVTAVGGTTLNQASNARGWTESAWSDAGAGCSAYEPKPSWQHDTGCTKRTVADVSAVADPNTGVAIYDTYGGGGGNATLCSLFGIDCPQPSGWFVVGGTSVASPIIASVYALAGNSSSLTYGSYPYLHPSSLNDVTTGSDRGGSSGGLGLGGATCSNYLCNAGPGYDGPTGLGTPNGTGAF